MREEDTAFPLSIQASILIGSLIIAIAVLFGGGVFKLQGKGFNIDSTSPSTASSPAPSASDQRVSGVTTGNLPTLGSPNAKVVVVEFADYQCPYCEAFFTDTEPQLKKDYIDTGKIQFAFRDFAFLGQPQSDAAGDESTNAANAARCANDQGKYWDYHDYLYSHQGQEDSGAFSKDNLKKFAANLGLNTDQFNQCVDNDTHVADVNADKTAAQGYGVDGTPTIFINGVKLVGAQPYATFKQAIDQELSSAK